jgi:hypothetical protein
MQVTKPAFGDVRAPRQWNDTTDKVLIQDVALLKHELDGCIYISVRLAMESDHDFTISEMNGQNYAVDGLFGIHVGDIMACGEGVYDIEKSRKAQPNEKATPREQSQLRGLLGALAWPSFQTQPHMAASVSLNQSATASTNIGDMLEVNKLLQRNCKHPPGHPRIWTTTRYPIWHVL